MNLIRVENKELYLDQFLKTGPDLEGINAVVVYNYTTNQYELCPIMVFDATSFIVLNGKVYPIKLTAFEAKELESNLEVKVL